MLHDVHTNNRFIPQSFLTTKPMSTAGCSNFGPVADNCGYAAMATWRGGQGKLQPCHEYLPLIQRLFLVEKQWLSLSRLQ